MNTTSFTLFDFLTYFCVYLVIGEVIVLAVCKAWKFGNREVELFTLALVFRILLTFGYFFYIIKTPSDPAVYFAFGASNHFNVLKFFTPGTKFIDYLCVLLYPVCKLFPNPFLMMFVPFSLFGFLGSLFLLRVVNELYGRNQRRMEPFLLSFFLPNQIFWTSNLGKDSAISFGIMLVLFGMTRSKIKTKNIATVLLGAAIVYFIRPHILLFLMVALGLGMLMERYALNARNLVLFGLICIGFLAMHQRILEFAGIKSENESSQKSTKILSTGVDQMQQTADRLNDGGARTGKTTRFNIVRSPVYFIQFVGAPFLWQARKPIQLLSALENIIYQGMFIYSIFHWKLFVRSNRLKYRFAWLLFTLLCGVTMGMAYTNFGITVREKCMVLPCIVLFFATVRAEKMAKKGIFKKQTDSARKKVPVGFMLAAPGKLGAN